MTQEQINVAVANLLLKGKAFQRTSGLAARFKCSKGAIVDAFEAIRQAFPHVEFTRVYGTAGGMGRL